MAADAVTRNAQHEQSRREQRQRQPAASPSQMTQPHREPRPRPAESCSRETPATGLSLPGAAVPVQREGLTDWPLVGRAAAVAGDPGVRAGGRGHAVEEVFPVSDAGCWLDLPSLATPVLDQRLGGCLSRYECRRPRRSSARSPPRRRALCPSSGSAGSSRPCRSSARCRPRRSRRPRRFSRRSRSSVKHVLVVVPPGFGLGWIFQVLPFQCSIRVDAAVPSPVCRSSRPPKRWWRRSRPPRKARCPHAWRRWVRARLHRPGLCRSSARSRSDSTCRCSSRPRPKRSSGRSRPRRIAG